MQARKMVRVARLTDKQSETLLWLARESRAHPLGLFPRPKRIAVHFGIARRTACERLDVLKEKGCLEGTPWQPMSLSLTELGEVTVGRLEEADRIATLSGRRLAR